MNLHDLLGRIHHEWTSRQRIFDLPSARIWKPADDVDLSFEFLGRRAATPIGPAAGPHSQMAQNIVLAWLGGSRVFELKTVQVLDDLEIARPCIDMRTIGFNIEWSQELQVAQSLEEYVKAWIIITLLSRWSALEDHLGPEPGPHVFDLSVGYDLAGIRSDKVSGFINGMRNATHVLDRLRSEIPVPFDREVPLSPVVADTVTLSTFHGCPPHEIEAITKHLIDEHQLDVIVKLNPTLLGLERVGEVVRSELGYTDVELNPLAFDEDLQFDQALALISDLNSYARANGRRFGIKLTNTLVVRNTFGRMPEETMYLSGAPLHVLATELAYQLAAALPGQLMLAGHDGDIQVSFSAGVTKENLVDTIATGVRPATICSDLLKPGGYGRLEPMLRTLTEAIRNDECTDLDSWRHHRLDVARADGFDDVVSQRLVDVLGADLARYHIDANSKAPRSVDHELQMWGCVACNFCVTVCPNDAFFRVPTKGIEGLEGRQQYMVLSELCNECGNCMTFCPEVGDPATIKPRLYRDPERYAAASGTRFLVSATGQVVDAAGEDAAKSTPVLQIVLDSSEGLPLARRLEGASTMTETAVDRGEAP